MITQYHKLALTAAFGLAIVLAFSCSSGKDEDTPSSSSDVAISSSGGDSSSDNSSSSGSSSSSGVSSSSASDNSNSSSSSVQSSSSLACTASDNTNTHYCSDGAMKKYGSVTDDGGQAYKTVEIGTQTWMAENLNYAATGSKCGIPKIDTNGDLTDENTATCDTYGRLYNWATAMALSSDCNSSSCEISEKHKGVCPNGWHIPSSADWATLTNFVGSTFAGNELKSASGWNSYNGNSGSGWDTYGFSALPGGRSGGVGFGDVGISGTWWSARATSDYYAYTRYIYYNSLSFRGDEYYKTNLYSVRCLQD